MSGARADVVDARWTAAAIDRLRDSTRCPVCGTAIVGARCATCGADLSGPAAQLLWQASQDAAVALERREQIAAGLPRGGGSPAAPTPVGTSAGSMAASLASASAPGFSGTPGSPNPALGAPPSAGVPAADPASSTPLQSLLSVAGAGLFGIAAIVFSFFTPALGDAARSAIIAVTGLLFLGGGWLLSRRGLRFSAETVAGLALVFLALNVQTVATASAVSEPWLVAAALTAIGSVSLVILAGWAGLRVWLWAGTLGIAAVPAMLGAAAGSSDGVRLGFLATAFVALAEVALLPRLGARLPVSEADPSGREEDGHEEDVHEEDPSGRETNPRPSAAGDSASAPFAVERGTLVAAQGIAIGIVLMLSAVDLVRGTGAMPLLTLAAVLVAVHALLATRNGTAALWSMIAGVAGAGAPVLAALSIAPGMDFPWFVVVCAAGVGAGLVLLGAVLPLPASARRGAAVGGALGVLAVALLPGTMFALMTGVLTLSRLIGGGDSTGETREAGSAIGGALIASLAIGAIALGTYARLAARRQGPSGLRVALGTLAIVPATLAVLALGAADEVLPLIARIAVLLVAAVATALRVRSMPAVARAWHPGTARALLLTAAHLAVVLAAMIGSEDPALMPVAGVATLAAAFVLGSALPAAWRFLLVGAGFGYALVLVSAMLALAGIGGVALLSLTATAGLLLAAAATVAPAVDAHSRQAMLLVAAVPFGIGVAQVLVERSGWTAIPTASTALLGVLLVGTRRNGVNVAVRLLAAAVVMPALAVSVLCLGAQLLPMSAAPIVLPVIAAIVAAVLPATRRIRRALATRGIGRIVAMRVQDVIEASALLTGALAVLLAVLREAAGFGTACLVLVLLSAGSAVAVVRTGRRHLRAVAALAATGALWSAGAALGVGLAEAYLLPPALALIVVGVVQALRGRPSTLPVAAGLLLAIVPVLMLVGTGDGSSLPRAAGLVATSWILAFAVLLLGRRLRGEPSVPLRRLRWPAVWFAAAAMVAGLAGPAQALLVARAARGYGAVTVMPVPPGGAALFLLCLGISVAGAAGMAVAARALRSVAETERIRASRWLLAPAVLAGAIGVWPAIHRDWFSIWGMWALMLLLLGAMLCAAHRAVRGGTTLPPVWFLFAVAFVTAVVAWSPRELRVEWFSLPLGLLLLAAGATGRFGGTTPMGAKPAGTGPMDAAPAGANGGEEARPRSLRQVLDAWPAGVGGSWALLAPGIAVTMLASVISTFTDPLTWRAILVMVLALAAILAGATRRLAAPFLIGLIVLPIENVFVFAVQIGRGIESMPWWITLALIGAVLLIIAATAERRAEHAPVTARLRDLR